MQVVTARGPSIVILLIVQLSSAAFRQQENAPQRNAPAATARKDQSAQSSEKTKASDMQAEPAPKRVTASLNPREEAWHTLEDACESNKASDRASATRVLGLIRNDPKASRLAEKALTDPKPEVRAAGAAALGDMHSRRSIPKLERAMGDGDPSVALAAANSLRLMHKESAYEVYSEVLSKERKSTKGLVSSQMATLKDRKKMAQLGFEEAIGFVPFAGIGWQAIKEVRKDDTSPVRAAAARVLADDPNPATTKLLEDAAGDNSWIVRAAALEALARRGDPSALKTVRLYLFDEKDLVRYTAAASTLRLMSKETKAESKKLRQRDTN